MSAILIVSLNLTYCRGAIVSLLVAVVVGVVWGGRSLRRRALLGGVAVMLVALLGVALYRPFSAPRTAADLGKLRAQDASIDASGSDANEQGVLPAEPSRQSDDARGRLIVAASRVPA